MLDMIKRSDVDTIYMCCGRTDLRKGIDGLAAVIEYTYKTNPYQQRVLFLFRGNRSYIMKGLMWEGDGFLLFIKRLRVGKLQWNVKEEQGMIEITYEQFRDMIKMP